MNRVLPSFYFIRNEAPNRRGDQVSDPDRLKSGPTYGFRPKRSSDHKRKQGSRLHNGRDSNLRRGTLEDPTPKNIFRRAEVRDTEVPRPTDRSGDGHLLQKEEVHEVPTALDSPVHVVVVPQVEDGQREGVHQVLQGHPVLESLLYLAPEGPRLGTVVLLLLKLCTEARVDLFVDRFLFRKTS